MATGCDREWVTAFPATGSVTILGLELQSVSIDQLSSTINTVVTYVPLLTLGMTVFLAWYVNYALKKRLYREELNERRLRELYRPMDMALRASRSAFLRYSSAIDEEKAFIGFCCGPVVWIAVSSASKASGLKAFMASKMRLRIIWSRDLCSLFIGVVPR